MNKIKANLIGATILGLIVITIVVPFKIAEIVPSAYIESKKTCSRIFS